MLLDGKTSVTVYKRLSELLEERDVGSSQAKRYEYTQLLFFVYMYVTEETLARIQSLDPLVLFSIIL